MARSLRPLLPRPATLILDRHVTAELHQRLHTVWVVVKAGEDEGRATIRRAHGVEVRPVRRQLPHHLRVAVPRRVYQRGAAAAARLAIGEYVIK